MIRVRIILPVVLLLLCYKPDNYNDIYETGASCEQQKETHHMRSQYFIEANFCMC